MSIPWTILPPVVPSAELVASVGHPLVAQLLAQRGITTPVQARSFLLPEYYAPAPPSALFGLDHAAHLLHQAIVQKQNILVWGDFDVDGQTSTALLTSALQLLAGDARVRFHVPNRFEESHGIRLPKLQQKLADPTFAPQVIVTCDTGIAEAEGISYAKDRGLTVIVTDHHDLPPELLVLNPASDPLWGLDASVVGPISVRRADAIVDPKFQPLGDPLRTLPGVGVAYKLVQQLFALVGRGGEESQLLDLVALGIVADVAEQVHDARYLLQLGLEQLRRTRRAGLQALMNISRINPASLSAESIGFQLGPRMNALGRLEDATVSVELLTTRDAIRAGQLAAKLERLNQERRVLTSQTTAAAMTMIEHTPSLLDHNGLVLAHPNWHAGIVGIVASRMVEEFGKPAVLLLTPPNGPARGSARSVPGVDIGAAIAGCSHLLLTHGGHPGAAGVSLLPENIDRFRRELSRQIELHRSDDVPSGLVIDAALDFAALDLALAGEINRLAPFGNGNPLPQFLSRRLTVVDDQRIGREGVHRKLTVRGAGGEGTGTLPVLWFDGADVALPVGEIDLVYSLTINEFRGERTLQLTFVAVRPAQEEMPEIGTAAEETKAAPAQTRQIYDWRNVDFALTDLPTPPTASWYVEGTRLERESPEVAFAPRTQLSLAGQNAEKKTLVLWTIPPSPDVLHWLVETVAPEAIYLCGRKTTDDSLDGILKTVGAMCKYALARDSQLDLRRMAARLGMTEAVTRCSLLWLENRGLVRLTEWQSNDKALIAPGDRERNEENVAQLQAELDEHLGEMRAYRRFFMRAKVEELRLM